MTLRWQCDTQGCYRDQLPDWGFLNTAMPDGITAGDIDGCVERNSCILVLEWKGPSGHIPYGQQLMFKNMSRIGFHNQIQILVIRGLLAKPTHYHKIRNGYSSDWKSCDNAILRAVVAEWFEFANNNGP